MSVPDEFFGINNDTNEERKTSPPVKIAFAALAVLIILGLVYYLYFYDKEGKESAPRLLTPEEKLKVLDELKRSGAATTSEADKYKILNDLSKQRAAQGTGTDLSAEAKLKILQGLR